MSKAFVKESDADDEAGGPAETAPPPGVRNYMTPAGFARLKAELRSLVEVERPAVVKTVTWAASNGDRSENGDYLYGKKRLREIDRRVRFLIKRLEGAEIVDSVGRDTDQVFFGATVTVRAQTGDKQGDKRGDKRGTERTVTIVGFDEVDAQRGRVSWVSPIAKALLKAREGDEVLLRSPGGEERLEIVDVRYDPID